jgi:topoisomerase-4 subunit A
LGSQQIWYDEDIRRLNTDGRGMLLGDFKGDDKLVVWTSKHQYYITGFGVDQHFPDETIRIEKYVAGRVYSLCYFDKEQNYYYMKRFQLEPSEKLQPFLEDENMMDFVAITNREGATLVVEYKGAHASRPADEVDVDSFIGVKSHRAKGKRITTYDVASLKFIEPELVPETQDAEEPDMMDDEVDVVSVESVDLENMASADATSSNMEYVVEQAESDVDAVIIDSEQLNLF